MVAVLFDMDGVVVDSETYWVEIERERILPEVVPDDDVAVSEITGRPYREIFTYLDERYDVAVTRERFLELFETAAHEMYGEQVALMDGFHELCADLRAAGVRLALVTSSPYDWVDVVIDRFDLGETFDAVVSADEVAAGKPEPDVYELAAEEVETAPADCVAVEDSPHGATAARAAGMAVLGYVGVHDALDHESVDAVAADPGELRELLFELLED